LNGETALKPGEIVEAQITEADETDLWAARRL
jgi:hypothetical protein